MLMPAQDRGNNAQHRMYVLKGTNDTDPTAPFQVGTLSLKRIALFIDNPTARRPSHLT